MPPLAVNATAGFPRTLSDLSKLLRSFWRGALSGRSAGQINAAVQPVTGGVSAFAMPLERGHAATCVSGSGRAACRCAATFSQFGDISGWLAITSGLLR